MEIKNTKDGKRSGKKKKVQFKGALKNLPAKCMTHLND